MIPLMSSAKAHGQPGIVRSCAIVDWNEEQIKADHISITYCKCSHKNCFICSKSKARRFTISARRQTTTLPHGGWERIQPIHPRVSDSEICP